MASGLLIKQKQLLAGDGITIEHAQTSSTISLSNSTLNAAVRIYDATIASDTGVVTITDGTPVADLNIGDEIRTPDGVYQKVKDGITTGSIPDDGSHILVSGCTDPTAVNGMYVATGEPNTWKNETGNYWISKLDGYGGPWWFIASSQAPANPGASSIHYRAMAATAQNPWDANFTPSHATGTLSVQKYSDLVSKTDTIDLFEYASLPVKPGDIVQSVNGNKPDASGNVTIETGSSVDESRLLPEDPEDGDVPVFNATATTGGGNDETVKLLIQPSTSGNQIVDSAAGNAAPATVNQGNSTYQVTVDESGELFFPGNGSYLSIPAVNVNTTITGDSEFCIDITMTPGWESGTRKILNLGVSSWYGYLNPAYGTFWFWGKGYDNIPMGLMHNVTHILTIEQWNDDGQWKVSLYTDGAIKQTFNGQIGVATSDMRFGIGDNAEGGGFLGTMNNIRLRNVAPYHGVSFQPDETPYTVPQVVGAWETKKISDAIDQSRLLPDPSTLSSDSEGNVVAVTKLAADANTIRLMHFNADFSDSVTGDSPVSTTNVSLQEPGKFGKSLHFDGNPPSDFYYPALSSSPDKWTIDFWIYLTQYQNSQAVLFLFGTVLNEADIALLRVNNTGIQMEVGYQNSVISGGESVSLNEWHHIAVTYADNTYKCYLDGNLYASQSSEKKVYFTKNLWLGSYFAYNGDHTMRGMIDEFRISNIVRWNSNFTPSDKEYEGGMLSYTITDPDELVSVDAKIATHNTSLDAHPMQGATTNDYNGLDTNCSWYLSYGDNTSNVNAPANGPFFVMTKKWVNSSETAGAGMQIAIRNMTGNLVNQSVYIRTWSLSSGWRTWQKVGSSAMAGTPDYGAGVDITSTLQQGVYAAPSAGWVYATANGVSISGNLIGNVTQIVLPVAAGDTITADVVTIAKFYPNR